jgi:hypothetical protein
MQGHEDFCLPRRHENSKKHKEEKQPTIIMAYRLAGKL